MLFLSHEPIWLFLQLFLLAKNNNNMNHNHNEIKCAISQVLGWGKSRKHNIPVYLLKKNVILIQSITDVHDYP